MRGLALAALLALCGGALAQAAEVRVSRGPWHVRVPIDVHVNVNGFERSPEPAIEVDPPDGASLTLLGVSPNVSTSIQVINGQMTRTDRVRFVYRYRLTPERAGPLAVTVNSFSSVSLDPPLVLWSIQNSSDHLAVYTECQHFGISVLSSAR